MGEKNNANRKYLQQHPTCCYCGGDQKATTIDHWPSRAIFDERKWPQDYKFPACAPCNAYSRKDEPLFALLARVAPADNADKDRKSTKKLIDAIRSREPVLFNSMIPKSANEKRRILRDNNLALTPGISTKDLPILSLGNPEIYERLKKCATKLFLSLHYFHTDKILPESGVILFSMDTNVGLMQRPPPEIANALPNSATTLRGNISLSNQFKYRYLADEKNGAASAFYVQLHTSLFMTGLVFSAPPDLDWDSIPQSSILRTLPKFPI